jgi:DNA polymerase III delta subunit
MATFAQHVKRRRDRPPKRVTWVCGPDEWLRHYVVRDVCVGRVEWYDHKAVPEWYASAFQHQGLEGERTLVLTGAERVKDWSKLELWVSRMREIPKTYLVCESSDPKLDTTQSQVELIKTKGDVIRCGDVKPSDIYEWLEQEFSGLSASVLNAVIKRVGGSPSRCFQVCDKLALFATARPEHVSIVTDEYIDGNFADLLVSGDKQRALQLAPQVEPRAAIGLLNYRLGQLSEMHRASRTMTAPRVPRHVAVQFDRVAGQYTPPRVVAAKELLVAVSEAVEQGAAVGSVEMLVRCW